MKAATAITRTNDGRRNAKSDGKMVCKLLGRENGKGKSGKCKE